MKVINTDHPIGGLYTQSLEQQLIFPLKHTEVHTQIAGNVARTEVIQSFENPFTQALEAKYIFPLPDEAAVDEMEIKIGDRTIHGNIKKREEAQQIYQQAKKQGRTAGLLEQERDNIFTQSLANIKPGEQIDVTIRYTESLNFTAGDYEFVFPMVVGPRYIPGTSIDGSADTDDVPDGSQITPPVIPPEMRSRHDINVTVEIDGSLPISNVYSPSHQIATQLLGNNLHIQLAKEDTIPNKDLIIRYQVAGRETQSTAITQADTRGGHFAVYLIPAVEYSPESIVPKDVVFLVDTSGSQSGAPLQQCQKLMERFINGLNPNDTFSILDFSHAVRQLSPTPLPNTPENRTKALTYINNLHASGGTEMLSGIRAAINFPTPLGRLRTVVLLTDGYIGNENQILSEVQKHLQTGNRLYSFGAGSSVNRFLLNRIAEVGRGISTIIRHDEPTQAVADKFCQQINNPVLTNIEITWEGTGKAPIIYPETPPDLFAEQPLVLWGRKEDGIGGNLHISGVAAGGKPYQKTFHLKFAAEMGNPAIAQLWGRARIKHLMNQMFHHETTAGVEAVTQTALTYQLLSQYTAFVAVSDDVRVNPQQESISVEVPVEMPEAVSYQGIFGETERERGITMDLMMMAEPVAGAAPAPAPTPTRTRGTSAYKKSSSFLKRSAMTETEEVRIPSKPNLEVVTVEGLDANASANLTQHLQALNLHGNFTGQIVFEFTTKKHRVLRVMLDEALSTLKEDIVIEAIKKSLLQWRVPQSITRKVKITLRIN
ncbi:MAG: VIT domain-containing protein [Calothrix sp. MO_167.B42]|nr:VIT domain-containing protein [Calothrix sp. MO_167.B42]